MSYKTTTANKGYGVQDFSPRPRTGPPGWYRQAKKEQKNYLGLKMVEKQKDGTWKLNSTSDTGNS